MMQLFETPQNNLHFFAHSEPLNLNENWKDELQPILKGIFGDEPLSKLLD